MVAKSAIALRRALADLDALTELPDDIRALLHELRAAVDACDARIADHAREDARCQRLREVTGIGPLTADAAVATVADAQLFKNGRQQPESGAKASLTPTEGSGLGLPGAGAEPPLAQ